MQRRAPSTWLSVCRRCKMGDFSIFFRLKEPESWPEIRDRRNVLIGVRYTSSSLPPPPRIFILTRVSAAFCDGVLRNASSLSGDTARSRLEEEGAEHNTSRRRLPRPSSDPQCALRTLSALKLPRSFNEILSKLRALRRADCSRGDFIGRLRDDAGGAGDDRTDGP